MLSFIQKKKKEKFKNQMQKEKNEKRLSVNRIVIIG